MKRKTMGVSTGMGMVMRRGMTALIAGVAGFALTPMGVAAQANQSYDSDDTRVIVEQFLEAHGGLDAWNGRGTAASYTHAMFTPTLYAEGDTHWWISHETIEYEDGGRVYHEWPIDGARVAFDGETTWWTGWGRPNAAASMRRTHYNFAFLPWLTQKDGVSLARGEDGVLPEDDVTSTVVTLTYPGRDKPVFFLYLDPETSRLRGWQYGGALHTVNRLGEADGILFPMDWSTRVQGNVIGYHSITQMTLHGEIDEAKLVMPQGAESQRAGSHP